MADRVTSTNIQALILPGTGNAAVRVTGVDIQALILPGTSNAAVRVTSVAIMAVYDTVASETSRGYII